MTRTDIAALAVRIAALYLCVNAFFQATSAASFAVQLPHFEGIESVLAGYVVAAVLLAIAGIALFRAAPTLARRMTGGDAHLELQDRAAIGSIALRLVLSGALILGGGTVARLWERLSTAGLNRRSDAA